MPQGGLMALVVKSVVGEKAKKAGVRVSADFYDEIDKKIEWMLGEAVKRCKANKRQTLYPSDL